MPGFDTTTVQSVNAPLFVGGDLFLSWTGTLPAGKIWQIWQEVL